MTPSLPWTPRGHFLRTLAKTGSVSFAATLAGLNRRTLYRWRDHDPDFRKRWDAALRRGSELIEGEAMSRALEGFEQPVWHQGRVVGHTRVTDNPVLLRLLERIEPGVYGQQAAELRAEAARTAELRRRLEAADKRAAAYEATLFGTEHASAESTPTDECSSAPLNSSLDQGVTSRAHDTARDTSLVASHPSKVG